jgi:hypothetical protein
MFPRTRVGEISLPRLVIGTNWFLGFSHTSAAKDAEIKSSMTPSRVADILEVFLAEGIDTVIGLIQHPVLRDGVREAEQRSGKKMIVISTPGIDVGDGPEAVGEVEKVLDREAELGTHIFMPHQYSTDRLIDMTGRRIRNMDVYCRMVRERGMIPGLSTHMPETIVYADESGLDVETYICIYNAAGFLMSLEVEWVHRIISNAKHPVITIKPLAAGRLTPLVGLAFNWATIRDIDMVAVGTSSPDEAREVIDVSRSILERRPAEIDLQWTRSKQTVAGETVSRKSDDG